MQLDEIKNFGKENSVPISLDDTLSFLLSTINQNNFKQILEIGTAIGYSSIAMATKTDCEHIDTVENDENRYKIAVGNMRLTGTLDKITPHLADAMDYIKTCDKKYDLIYLDGAKNQYINYLPYLTKCLKIGGIIMADNLYFHGMVLGKVHVTTGCRAMIKSLHRYIAEITTNPIYDTIIYDIGDGVGVTRLKGESFGEFPKPKNFAKKANKNLKNELQ